MTLVGVILMAIFSANLAVELLRRGGVAGFHTPDDAGSVLLATLSFHGAAIVAGVFFLKFHGFGWREVLGLPSTRWSHALLLSAGVLLAAFPVMLGLKAISELVMEKIGWAASDQLAVEMFSQAKSAGLKIYLGVFTVVLAPVAEEFIFRGLIFSGLKKIGWPKCAWLGSSLLFAFVHGSLPIFLPLFVFALALTWLYEKTEGLLAPILTHSLFNATNLTLLVLVEKYGSQHP